MNDSVGFFELPRVGVDIRHVKENVVETCMNGLQEIEGWLDFGGAAEEIDTLEQDIWNGGTQSTQDARGRVFSSLRWRLEDFLEQAGRLSTCWSEVTLEADMGAQDFVERAIALGIGNPEWCAWKVCEPLEDDIYTFVHRAAGNGSRDFSCEAAGNFVLLVEAVEECRRHAREMQEALEKVAAESLTLGQPLARRKGPPCALTYKKALEEGFSATEALAMASAAPPRPVRVS